MVCMLKGILYDLFYIHMAYENVFMNLLEKDKNGISSIMKKLTKNQERNMPQNINSDFLWVVG